MKVAIVGAGAMGCLYGGALHRAGHDVTLIDVNADHIAVINRNGLDLETRAGRETLPLRAMHPSDATEVVDLIVLFTKTFHTAAALSGVQAIIGPDTHVLTLQNGLGNAERVAAHVAQDRVLVGASTLPSDLLGPGRVRSHGDGVSRLYPAFGEDPGFAQDVVDALNAGGLIAELDSDIFAAIWSKAIFNSAMNTMCALTRRTPGFLGAHEESLALIHAVVEEGAATARACGAVVDAGPIHDLTKMGMADHADHEPSMLQDVKAGRPTEVDAINGAIVAKARENGVSVPVTETLWRLVKLEDAKLAE